MKPAFAGNQHVATTRYPLWTGSPSLSMCYCASKYLAEDFNFILIIQTSHVLEEFLFVKIVLLECG